MAQNCPLCNTKSAVFYNNIKQLFYLCGNCHGIFLDKNLLLSRESEFLRYQNHNNDVNDVAYQQFVSPIVSSVLQDFKAQHGGLDYGAGPGPVISKLLQERNFQIEQYDPFFHDFPELLHKKYHYIVCCEVMEHFHNPYQEFSRFKEMLLPGGRIYCMTEIYHFDIDFGKWYYKNDPTHVFIYQRKTMEWIRDKFNFTDALINGRKTIFYT